MSVEKYSAGIIVYSKNISIAVLGGGVVGKTCTADMKPAGREVHLFDIMPFVEKTLANLGKTGTLLDGVQRSRYCSEWSGRAYLDVVTNNIEWAVKGAGLIVVAAPAMAHEPFLRALTPYLEDGQVIHIFTDNYVTLLLRRLMREMGCTKQVTVDGWSFAPYGTRLESVDDLVFLHVGVRHRVTTLHGAPLPMSDTDAFMEPVRYLPCIDVVIQGEGPPIGNTVPDIGFASIDPMIHVPATVLGMSTMENWGVTSSGHDKTTYSVYSHGLSPSIYEARYQFYEEEKVLAKEIGVGMPSHNYKSFFSRRSVLIQECIGLDEDGKDNAVFPLDQLSSEGNTGPNNINHRYLTEDVPVGCKIYHDLGVQYRVPTPIIDSMIASVGAMYKKGFFEISKYDLAYLRIDNMPKEELLAYLNEGVYNR